MKKSPFDVDKTALIQKVLDYYDVRYNRSRMGWQKVRCPGPGHSHGDRNPSASVSLKYGYYNCFACGLEGDGFDLLLELDNILATEVETKLGNIKEAKEEPEWLF